MSPEALVMEILGDGEKSGAEIARGFSWWSRLFGEPYPTLIRLERSGMIESRWALMPRPRRRLYRAADIGLGPLSQKAT